MAGDYIPDTDARFHAWQNQFVTYVNDHLADLGLDPADVVDLNDTAATWTGDYPAHSAAQKAARAARQAKDLARTELKGTVRLLVRRLQVSPNVGDDQRAAMGITVPDRVATPVGPPTTRPVVRVDSGLRLEHRVHFADESTPTRRAKPSGVIGAEIWVKVAELQTGVSAPPTDPSELSYLSMDTRSPYVARFPGADGGKTAHYMLRWMSTTGHKGPWSETASATIGA